MTAELSVLQRLRVYEEPNLASYGLDNTVNLATAFLDVPAIEGSIKPTYDQELVDPKISTGLLEYQDLKLPGRARPGLSFSMPLHSHGIGMDGVVAVPSITTWALGRILKAIFGGFATTPNGGTRAVLAGSTTTVINVTAGRGADFVQGDAIGVRVGAAGTIECREVLSSTANTVTVVEAFSAAPVTGATVYGCATVYTIDDPQTALQFVLEGTEPDNRKAYYGMQGSPKFDLPVGDDVPKVTVDLKGCRWASLGSAAIAASSFANISMVVPVFNELHYTTVAGSPATRVVVDQSAQTYEPAIQYMPVLSGAAVANNNVLRMKRTKVRPPLKSSFTGIFEDTSYEAARLAGTSKRTDLQLGNAPGSTILISQRLLQVVDVKEASAGGIGSQQVMLEGRIPSGTSPSVSAIHFF